MFSEVVGTLFEPNTLDRIFWDTKFGAVAQLVRALDCRSRGCGFEPRSRRLFLFSADPVGTSDFCFLTFSKTLPANRQLRTVLSVDQFQSEQRQNYTWNGIKPANRVWWSSACRCSLNSNGFDFGILPAVSWSQDTKVTEFAQPIPGRDLVEVPFARFCPESSRLHRFKCPSTRR